MLDSRFARSALSALVLFGATPALAQEAEGDGEAGARANLVVADLSLGVISVGYERVVDDGISLAVSAGLYGPWYRRDGVRGAGGEVRAFLFPAGSAPGGVYVAPGFRAAYVTKDEEGGTRDGYALSGRVSIGYSFVWEILVVRLGFGFQMHVLDLDEPRDAPSDDFAEPFPVADIYVGLRF